MIVRHQFFAMLWVGTALAVGSACSSAKERGSEWVDLVQRAHQRVDEGATSGAPAVEPILRAAIAEAPENPNERQRWLIQDLHYRLAQVLLDAGDLERAAIEVGHGLRADDAATLARANLLALQGKTFERQGDRQKAAEAFHAALLINELLMDKALTGTTESAQ